MLEELRVDFGTMLGILGILLSIIFFIKGRRVPIPKISFNADHALSWPNENTLPESVKVFYRDKEVPRIARCTIRIWNDGKQTLEKDLVPAKDPLKLTLKNNGEFLAVTTLKSMNEASSCSLKINPRKKNEATIHFDFIDPGEGALFAALHTDEVANPILSGTIKGHKIKQYLISGLSNSRNAWKRSRRINRRFAQIVLIVGSTVILTTLLPYSWFKPIAETIFRGTLNVNNIYTVRMGFVFAGVFYVLPAAIYLWRIRRLYPKPLAIGNDADYL